MKTGVIAICLSVLSVPAQAQWTITAQAGVHFDRTRPSQRALLPNMFSAPGEATTFGLVIAHPLGGAFALAVGGAVATNHSWAGASTYPPPVLAKRTIFTSGVIRWRTPVPGLSLGAGPAVIFHGGTGTSLLTRQTDDGAVLEALTEVRFTPHVRLTLMLRNYEFASRFIDPTVVYGGIADVPPQPSGSRWRSEWVLLPGLTFAW